jgi:hypothetical protein
VEAIVIDQAGISIVPCGTHRMAKIARCFQWVYRFASARDRALLRTPRMVGLYQGHLVLVLLAEVDLQG